MSGRTPLADRRKIVFVGLRGVPKVQGGVEAHVAALATRLSQRGWDVEVIGRSRYLPRGGSRAWGGVVVTPLWAPHSKYAETIVHTLLCVLKLARSRPDIVHIHAIGPALLAPIARLLGLCVVVTHHGSDYDRQKWGLLARTCLRLGERLGMSYSHARIAVSPVIASAMSTRWQRPTVFIPNGVDIRLPQHGSSLLNGFGLAPGRYVLCVARIVEEKRQLDLIAAFSRVDDPTLKLAIVGGAEYGGAYLRQVEQAAAMSPNVVMTGFQQGEALAQLFAYAALFVLPSSHEGMPIALLEALGHGLPVLASNIPAHRALGLAGGDYVTVGEVAALADAMREKLQQPTQSEQARQRAAELRATQGWDSVADRTLRVYEEAVRSVQQKQALPHSVETAR